MKGEWKKTVHVQFDSVIDLQDVYVQADVDVSGWWDEGRLWGDNAYPPESGWQIDDVNGFIEFYDHDGGITHVVEFTEYSRQIDAEIEFHVEKELQRL
jgi:hypothetical protein